MFLCAGLGFTIQQAEIIVSALVKITETNMDIVYKDMVSKMQQVMWGGVAGQESKRRVLQEISTQVAFWMASIKKCMSF